MIAHIVCGSPNLWLPKELIGYVVGVDRGAIKLIEKKIDFDVAIGDFDSVSRHEHQLIKENVPLMLGLSAEKDVTDCEAAVEHVVGVGYRQIHLYGATGARLDHQFATIGMMLKYAKQDIQIYMEDAQNKISVLMPEERYIEMNDKKYISFFALEETVKNLTLQDVKYPLEGYDLAVGDSLCVSNEAISLRVSISFDTGHLLVVQSKD